MKLSKEILQEVKRIKEWELSGIKYQDIHKFSADVREVFDKIYEEVIKNERDS